LQRKIDEAAFLVSHTSVTEPSTSDVEAGSFALVKQADRGMDVSVRMTARQD